MKWNSDLYNEKHGFISGYGEGILKYIPNKPGLYILDIGCGTGTLTNKLKDLCDEITGMDSSSDMINKAKLEYPEINFVVGDALCLEDNEKWDVIFSNAVFHWIHNHDLLLENIYRALKFGGMLICEFGAHGNIIEIETGFKEALKENGYNYKPKFNFPTVEEFSRLLTSKGFVIDEIVDYDRMTPLEDGSKGLRNWAELFFASELSEIPMDIQDEVFHKLEERLRPILWDGKIWTADYRRLRVVAHKEEIL